MSNSLLQRIAAGDEAAVKACIEEHGGRVWALARRFSRGNADAEDAVQDIFISLWKSAHRYDPERASEAAFVCTIARRRLIDRLRARGGREEPLSVESMDLPHRDTPARTEAGMDLARVRTAMEALEPEARKVLEMAVVEGYSHGQISEATGIALGTVKSHVRRSLQRVRSMLAPAQEVAG